MYCKVTQFSISKIMSVRPIIQSRDEVKPPLMYDLIIGLEYKAI